MGVVGGEGGGAAVVVAAGALPGAGGCRETRSKVREAVVR